MATLGFAQNCRAKILVKAHSLAAARRRADKMTAFDVDWNPVDGRMFVEHVAEFKPRKKARPPCQPKIHFHAEAQSRKESQKAQMV